MRDHERSQDLAGLWEIYRLATPAPEPSVNFTPELWARIDSARPASWVLPLTRLAARLAPVAVAATLALGVFAWPVAQNAADHFQVGYVDVLAADLLEEQQPALWLGLAEDSFPR
jgi:hypothetical protein